MRTERLIVSGGALSVAAICTAGELAPPPGPVEPTGRFGPRIEINQANTPGDNDLTPSLYKITEPGSYYLGGNVSGAANKHGIEIAADGVTIDLMGFEMRGFLPPPPLAGASLDGIMASVPVANVHIYNGSLQTWGGSGIDLLSAENSSLRNIRASNNSDGGLRVGNGGVVIGCSARDNGGIGIAASVSSTVSNNVAVSNGSHGIQAWHGSVVSQNAAQSNGGDGFNLAARTLIRHNTASFSGGNGISLSQGCLVLENLCLLNGNNGDGAGIHSTNNRNRIDGNAVYGNDRGIDVDWNDSLIIRNTATLNTINYDIAADNRFGPIVDLTGLVVPAVSGSSAPSSVVTSDPWANFSY